jgi:Domain of unknown function (DUF2383)
MDNDDVIDALNDLIGTSKDGEYVFACAPNICAMPDTKQLFTRHAEECRAAVDELQPLVMSLAMRLGDSAEDSGSVAGAAHRGRGAMRSTHWLATPTKPISNKPNVARTLRWSARAQSRCSRRRTAARSARRDRTAIRGFEAQPRRCARYAIRNVWSALERWSLRPN